jgi:ubiquinone/menaquinone biosynthesis C-methylase UbiE
MSLRRRLAYQARQTVETLFHAGLYAAARRVAGGAPDTGPLARPRPGVGSLRRALMGAFQQDMEAIDLGLYPAPRPSLSAAARTVSMAPAYLREAREILARRGRKGATEAREEPGSEGFPVYYRQNFHWQSGGWLTDESARLYGLQVQTLFTGAADAMRRSALALLAQALKGKDSRTARVADVACGDGGFLADVARAFPAMGDLIGLDMSPAYVRAAQGRLLDRPRLRLIVGDAGALPFPDASLDALTSIYLFHELPPKVRTQVASEIARVLKPGGTFVFADSLQYGDEPALDRLLEAFPKLAHEPYFESYQTTDLTALFGNAGLDLGETQVRYLTKAMAFSKPATS